MARLKPPVRPNPAYQAAMQSGTANDALFGTSRDFPQIVEIDVARITPNPDQPRRVFRDDQIQSLADSIAAHGLKQPVLVRRAGQDRYQLVAGERRWRAHCLLQRPTIFAILTEGDSAEVALIENLQRVDLNLLEKADAFAAMSQREGYTHERLARLVALNRTEVTRIIGLHRLAAPIRRDYLDGHDDVAKGILFELAEIDDPDQQCALWEKVKSGLTLTGLRSAKSGPAAAPRTVAPDIMPAPLRGLLRHCRQLAHDPNPGTLPPLSDEQRASLRAARAYLDRLLGGH